MEINNFKKKKLKLLTKKQQKSFKNANICYICGETFEDKFLKIKYIVKLEIIAIIQVNIEVLNIVYAI